MIYHLKSRQKKNPIKYIVIGIFSLLLIFNLAKINPFGGIIGKLSYPIIKTGSLVASPFSGFSGYFSSKKELERRILSLEEELEKKRSQILENEFLRDENKMLKEDFGRDDASEVGVLGMVLKRPPYSPYDTFVIDLGNEKISTGQIVYIYNVPVGEVVEVGDMTSIVQLFSSSDVSKKVMIGGIVEAEAIGKGGGRFTSTISEDSGVEIGDVVTLSESNQYVLGVVESIEKDDTRTLTVVRFNFPFSLNTMRFVEVR